MRALRSAVVLGLFVLAAASTGCLRPRFDLCAEDPPHPDCPSDAGPDAAIDAARVDAPTDEDASTDAPTPVDAPTTDDAPMPVDDASNDDAGPDAP
ncbi:MAG: hypothetical protein J0L92_23105 [Deltaproteobacteria bacterium]|nr:hypothetical protein [Deltaproteobacteria bacterium]